ncbi:VOC family protein [Lentzea sp. NPDC034063]|uniref:VOC family protein n=1 Tax=unclassified Lentzea TaxID=2643253 RepID=UPI0033CEA96E
MGSIKQIQVTFDCTEPQRVAQFWSVVLGYDAQPETDGSWSACNDPSGVGPRLFFQRVPEGKTVKNRVHLDVRAGTGMVGRDRLAALQAERRRLEAIGAVCVRVMEADEENESCIVMQDVEGNEFCLD